MDAAWANVVIDVQDDDNTHESDINVEDEETWFNSLQSMVERTNWGCHYNTIYRVPGRLRMVDSTAYEPQILSLGPYHHGEPRLEAMEKIKLRYLKSFLMRKQARGLADYLKLVEQKEEETRAAYSEAPQMESKEWVEMMLLDSCFALEFFLTLEESDDEEADPIKSTSWVGLTVLSDILLLENPRPFFLLEELLELNSSKNTSENSRSLAEIASSMFTNLMPGKIRDSSDVRIGRIHHFLHLLYSCSLPVDPIKKQICSPEQGTRLWSCINPLKKLTRRKKRNNCSSSLISEPFSLQWVPSAKNLKDAGVAFRKRTKKVKSFMDITFERGTLEIPPLKIFHQSNTLFRNLIAFEQCNVGCGWPVQMTAYAHLMDCIINTPIDVDLLQQEGIIVLGNNGEVALFFNRLRTNAVIQSKSYLSGVFDDVKHHCEKKRNKWKASLNHNYFSNPWAIVSVIAAIVLFLLTTTQTVFTVLSYYQLTTTQTVFIAAIVLFLLTTTQTVFTVLSYYQRS